MIFYFKFSNFKTFIEEEISFISSSNIKKSKDEIVTINNFSSNKFNVIFGANSSGKSNVVKAFKFLKDIVTDFENLDTKNLVNKALKNSEEKPSFFHIVFSVKNKVFDYKITLNLTKKEILKEELSEINDDLVSLFSIENNNKIKLKEFSEPYSFFTTHLKFYSYRYLKLDYDLLNKNYLNKFKDELHYFDSSLKNINLTRSSLREVRSYLPPILWPKLYKDIIAIRLNKENSPYLINLGFNLFIVNKRSVKKLEIEKNNDNVLFSFEEESDGNSRLYPLVSFLLNINEEDVIFIDEIDKSLHESLVISLLKRIKNYYFKDNNQLIITTHEINLLEENFFKKDSIYFVNKNKSGISELYSLIEFKDVDLNKIKEDYLNGRFGAINIYL